MATAVIGGGLIVWCINFGERTNKMYVLRLKGNDDKWRYVIDVGMLGLPMVSLNINEALVLDTYDKAVEIQSLLCLTVEVLRYENVLQPN